MSIYIVDVESDGPIPNKYSMVCFGAVKLDKELKTVFYGKTKPISSNWLPEALSVSGFTRTEHENFNDPNIIMDNFKKWIIETNTSGRPIFISDNNGFDWQWINYYFHYYVGSNPFGFSSRRMGDLYSGLVKDSTKSSEWKKFRKTKHSHNPVDDAKGNAEALLHIINHFNLKMNY